MNQHFFTILIVIVLIVFSIFRRVRRNIGWQKLSRGKLVFRIVLFLIVGLIFLGEGIIHPISLISDCIGILLGIVLSYYGIVLTSFNQKDDIVYYRPNIWIGSLVTIIFLFRFVFRFYELYASGVLNGMQQGQTNGSQNMVGAMSNSWTTGLMLIMFAYYTIYYVLLLRKSKNQTKENIVS